MAVASLGGERTVHDPGEPGIFGRPPRTYTVCDRPVFEIHDMAPGASARVVIADSSGRIAVEFLGATPRTVTLPRPEVLRGDEVSFLWSPATDVLVDAQLGFLAHDGDIPSSGTSPRSASRATRSSRASRPISPRASAGCASTTSVRGPRSSAARATCDVLVELRRPDPAPSVRVVAIVP
jgi:hypothetical protein